MRIDLQDLSTTRLSLSLPEQPDSSEQPRSIVLRALNNLRGTLTRTRESFAITAGHVDSADIEGLDWRTKTAHVVIAPPASVHSLDIGMQLVLDDDHTPAQFHLQVDSIDTETLSTRFGGRRISTGASVRALQLSSTPEQTNVSLESLLVREVQTIVAGLLCRAITGSMTRASLATGSASTKMSESISTSTVEVASVAVQDISASDRGIDLTIREVELETGATLAKGELRCPVVRVSDVTCTVEDIGSLITQQNAHADTTVEPDTKSRSWREFIDLTQLDRLTGRMDVDVEVDVTLPVYGRRVSKHEFRLPITDGIFNFRQLERGLSALEDSIIDFEVRDNALVLERDIPLIGMEKDLIRWPLVTEQDVFLAKQRSVRLRTMASPEIVANNADKPKRAQQKKKADRSLKLSRVDVNVRKIELAAVKNDGGDTLGPGAITDISLTGLRTSGHLHIVDGRPGELNCEFESLSVLISDLTIGTIHILQARVIINGLRDARITFDGLSPRSIQLSLADVRLEDVVIQLSD